MTAESSSRDNGNIWVIVPFALAIVGTVVMLFTNSANALKISLILALWAAAAGLIVIFRMRRDRDEATRALEDRESQHKAELERLEQRPASSAATVDDELLRELQAEIKALRTQLEEMSGQVFEYEPAAVRAAARRIQEIEQGGATSTRIDDARVTSAHATAPAASATASAADTAATDTATTEDHADTWRKTTAAQPSEAVHPVAEDTPEPEPVAPFRNTSKSDATTAPQSTPQAEPKDEPKTEREEQPASKPEAKGPSSYDTAKITRVTTPERPSHTPSAEGSSSSRAGSHRRGRPTGAPSSDAVAGKIGQTPQREQQNPLSALISERAKAAPEAQAQTEAQTPAKPTRTAQPQPNTAAPAGQSNTTPEPAPASEATEYVGRHEQPDTGTRGSADNSGNLDTAATASPQRHAAGEERAGGRRRRDAGREGSLSVAELLARSKRS